MFPLSLLSRGNGQVVQSKQKRLEVYLEPEDYLNLTPQGKPPIRRSQDEAQITYTLPKTYSTRKGVLLLYSEDLAQPSWKQEERKKDPCLYRRQKKKKLGFALHTLKDLRTAILAYGSEGKHPKDQSWQPYLHFLSNSNSQTEQQIRPGYSAKRYLLSLFQNWTPSTLYKFQCSGCIRDPRLFQDNQLYLPNHIRRQQDLSAIPSKYRLLPVHPSISPFWTEKEQLSADDDADESDSEDSEDSTMEKEYFRVEKYWKENTLLPPLKQKSSGKVAWLDDEDHREDTWMVPREKTPTFKESQGLRGKSQPPLGTSSVFTTLDTYQFLSQRSHSTFFGGTIPDNTDPSEDVKTSEDNKQLVPVSLEEKCALPPVEPTSTSEQNIPENEKKKKMSKSLKLPPIPEPPSKAQESPKSQLNVYGIPQELLILPLEVHLCTALQLKEKGQRGDNAFSHLDAIPHKRKNLRKKSHKIQKKTSNSRSPKDFIGDEMNQGNIPKAIKGSSPDPEPGNMLMGPAGDTACQALLGSVQSMDLPFLPDFASGEASPALVDSNTNLGEEWSSDQHVRKGNFYPKTSLHVNVCETSSILPSMPEEKGAPQSLEAAVLKTGESQSFINKELENKRELEYQKGQPSTVTENQQDALGNEGITLTVRIETEKLCSNYDTFPESQGPIQDDSSLSLLDPLTTSLSVMEIQTDGSSTKGAGTGPELWGKLGILGSQEAKKPRNETSGPFDTSELEQNLNPRADTIKELGEDNEILHHLTGPLGNATMPPKMAGSRKNRTEKQPLSRSRKGKDAPPKLSKQAEDRISPERQMPEKTKRRKRNEVNKSKAPNTSKGEKIKNRSEFVGGKPKKQKIENKTTSKKKKPRAKRKEMGQKIRAIEIRPEQSNSLSTEEPSDEDSSFSAFSLEDFEVPLKFDDPESQVSRDEKSFPTQPINTTENIGSEEDQSADTSKMSPVTQHQEKIPREKILAERAEMRLREVERRRKEKEEKKRQQQEAQKRLEKLKEELEQEQQRRAEEKRLQRQRLEEERQEQEEEERRKLQQEQAAEARAKQLQEEYRRKLQEMQRRRQEDEARRAEAEKQRQKELKRMLEEEQLKLMEMAKEERLLYQKKKEEEEEKAREEAEAKRQKEEEKARLALEKAQKEAEQLEREKADLEPYQNFNQDLLKEVNELKHIQNISRPWVYSYFRLLKMPGAKAVMKRELRSKLD
ncbi:uncharacterized protein KIAA2012 homolog isoform X3 [Monodelphis domestica]|uniref:uncharacterized protein KIAA2012 homolog isoform X3 n=1 Tax=Monodelphis domestica TaxID=13616 RepID=UPI0024E1DE0F|nr:uncharacterized protein KIAA2012 homolog isoform X3 [Monodelphis domestica]